MYWNIEQKLIKCAVHEKKVQLANDRWKIERVEVNINVRSTGKIKINIWRKSK